MKENLSVNVMTDGQEIIVSNKRMELLKDQTQLPKDPLKNPLMSLLKNLQRNQLGLLMNLPKSRQKNPPKNLLQNLPKNQLKNPLKNLLQNQLKNQLRNPLKNLQRNLLKNLPKNLLKNLLKNLP